jgi:hypothetical protein
LFYRSNIESEVTFRVFKTDRADQVGECCEVIGQFAAIGFGADEIAENPPEVFVAWE